MASDSAAVPTPLGLLLVSAFPQQTSWGGTLETPESSCPRSLDIQEARPGAVLEKCCPHCSLLPLAAAGTALVAFARRRVSDTLPVPFHSCHTSMDENAL